ncbi:MAG: rhodanese-like domain-containing protein [Chloroflexota bacterium]
MLIGAGFLLIVLLAATYLLFGNRAEQGERDTAVYPAEISVADAVTMRESGVFFLDVREQVEWDSFHIPDSTHIPLGQLSQRLSELPPDQEIVVVCRTGNRSQEGRTILQAAGWDQVTSMAGGVVDWQAAGYPIVTGP